jgi:hypothetical protein
MNFKRCAESGCGFHVPATYPLSKCPWHLAPGRSPGEKALVVAGAFVIFAAGYGLAKGIEAWRASRRRVEVRKGQDEWRQLHADRAKRESASAATRPPDAGLTANELDRAEGDT